MGSKIKLQLGSIDNIEEMKTCIINGLTYEFILDTIRVNLRAYDQEIDLTTYMGEFSQIVEKYYDRTYVDFLEWSLMKTDAISELMQFVVDLDKYLTENEKINEGQLIADFQNKLTQFLFSLNNVHITEEYLDTADVEIKESYIKSTLAELAIVNEAKLLTMIIGMDLDVTPIDDKASKNSIIEKKLAEINKIVDNCNQLFEGDIEKTIDHVLDMQNKFYNICYESLTDGEKAEKARKVVKQINVHRQLLDKLENKLTDAHELGRQLFIHQKKLEEGIDLKKQDALARIAEDSTKRDMIEFETDSANYVSSKYIFDIEKSIEKLNELKEKIAEHYNTLDKLEDALKNAIPSENEMKKYSSIGFKLQELSVKLDMAKPNISKEDKEVFELIKTAKSGIKTMIAYANEIKDLFMRNSMMSSAVNSLNAIYGFVNGQHSPDELVKLKRITERLTKYSEACDEFSHTLVNYRNVGNAVIRDISIIMGKAVNGVNLLEILDIMDKGIQSMDTALNELKNIDDKERDLLDSILTI